MPEAVQQGFDPKARMNRHEADWELVSVTSFDGLGRTQIERKFIAPGKGLDTREATALPFLLDATPNADDRGNEAGTTTDERRYVVNPRMVGGQFAGLWTGGPVKWDDDPRAQVPKHQVTQTLTRTWPAGHGYTLDEAGRYVFSADPTSLEFATAAAALMNHRPALASKFSARLAFRDDVPGAYWREVTWRDFTHESMPYIEALRSDKIALGRILAYHFGADTVGYTPGKDAKPASWEITIELTESESAALAADVASWAELNPGVDPGDGKFHVNETASMLYFGNYPAFGLAIADGTATGTFGTAALARLSGLVVGIHHAAEPAVAEAFAGAVEDLTCDVDRETNTVVVKCAILLKELQEPATVEDLLKLPRIEGPCERETLRLFGWADLSDGEGYRYTHRWKWVDLKDTPAVRAMLEFGVHDKDVLPTLLSGPFATDSPTLVENAADADNGRYVANGKAWWRIALMRTEADDKEGSLTFEIDAVKPDWFGSPGKSTVDAATQNPQGQGLSRRRVVASLPREAAAAAAAGAAPDAGFRLTEVSRQEHEDGREDVATEQRRAWTWDGTSGGKPPATTPLDGIEASEVRHVETAKKESWDVTFEQIDGASMASLIARMQGELLPSLEQGKITVKGCSQDAAGFYRLVLHAEGVEKKEFAAWLYTGTYFSTTWRKLRFNVPLSDCTEGGLDGQHRITTADRNLNDDGTWDETVTRVDPSQPRHLRFKAKSRPHGHAVEHDWFRNETELPDGLRNGSVAGSAHYNEHGLIDGETADVDQEDDGRRSATEDHFHREESETATDGTSRLPDAGIDENGTITSVQEQENGDDTFTHTVATDTPKPCRHVVFLTKEGDAHHPRRVTHTVYRNAPELPAQLLDLPAGTRRVAGSDEHNRYGLHDGRFSEWDAADDEDRRATKEEDRFHLATSQTGTGPYAPTPAEYRDGTIANRQVVTMPDGTLTVTAGEDAGKAASWSYSYDVRNGDKSGTVTVREWRNAASTPSYGPLAGDMTRRVTETLNRYGLWDVTCVDSPNWKGKGDAAAAAIESETYSIKRTEERRIRNTSGDMIDQTREVTVTHSVKAGTMTIGAALRHINGGDEGSRYQAARVKTTAGMTRNGYIADKVSIQRGPWQPPA